MSLLADETRWHDDGHRVALELHRSELTITTVICPHEDDPLKPCQHRSVGCVVRWFLDRFGLECHVGVCVPDEELSLAWALLGDEHDLDAAQVWVISTSDDIFAGWASTVRAGGDE
jgi:hypothetical protein